MNIRKQYKFEASHIVRNCSSDRCSHSIHGHSYIVEVIFTSNQLDAGGMIYDFGLTKGTIGDFIDSFDHCHQIWSKESSEFKDFFANNCDRVIIMPVSPSAENYALMFLQGITRILDNTVFGNGEGVVGVHSVRVHETKTGYAEAFKSDLDNMYPHDILDLEFSYHIMEDWKYPMTQMIKSNELFVNDIPVHQI